jgi:hypothetical protein
MESLKLELQNVKFRFLGRKLLLGIIEILTCIEKYEVEDTNSLKMVDVRKYGRNP